MSLNYDSLKSMCELIVDCPHSTPKWTEEGVVVLRNQNIRNGVLDLSKPSFTNLDGYNKRIKRAIPQAGDIVFTREAPMGQVCIIPEGLKCCLGQRQVLLRPKKDISGEYLFWALQSPYVQRQISWNEGTGSTVSNIRIPVLEALKIPRQLSKEKSIAKVLSDLSGKIELNRQTNQTLEQIAQAIFKSWFVDFEPTRAKAIVKLKGGDEKTQALAAQAILCGAITLVALNALADEQSTLQSVLNNLIHTKLAAQNVDKQNHNWLPEQLISTAKLFPNQLVDSELGKIPDGWKIKKVSDILARLKPKKRYTKKQVKEFGNIPIFEQGIDILMGFHCEKPGFIASPEKPLFIFGDHTCVTHLSCQPFDISQNVIPLMGNGYQTLWVYYAIQDKQEFQEYRRHWSEFIIKNVITPKVLLTEAFTDVVTALYIKKEQSLKESMVLQQLRDTLLPKLLSGELSVDTEQFDELQNDRVSA